MKCECLLSKSKVIDSRKEDSENIAYRCRECEICGNLRITIELDFKEVKSTKTLRFLQIPWNYFRLAKVRRLESVFY